MRYELFFHSLRAAVDTFGGELVSLQDASGTEYIWQGDPTYWGGRNPLLFPIIGKLKDETVCFGGKPYPIPKHGIARKREFTLLEQEPDRILLELREDDASFAVYPYPFALRVEHRLSQDGFTTTIRVENTGTQPMPFTIGGHTGFRCPLFEDTRFEDYQVVFDQPETTSTILVTPQGLLSSGEQEPLLENQDHLTLDYAEFARLDTYVLEGLRSTSVHLRHKESGHGVRMDFSGFPMLGIWTIGARQAPFLCLEPWHGCPAYDNDSGIFEDKPHCLILQPGEIKKLAYTVTIL